MNEIPLGVTIRPVESTSGFESRVAFVTGGLNSGGSTALLILLAQALQNLGTECVVYSFGKNPTQAEEFRCRGIICVEAGHDGVLFEDQLQIVLQALAKNPPAAVVSCLGSTSYEVLRYLPAGIQRIGMVVSDDPTVYRMVTHYGAHLDIIAGNARTITEQLALLPGFGKVRKEWFVTGVLPPEKTRVSPNLDAPLQIVTLSRIIREQKRVQLFPQILQELETASRPMRWTIIGEGPDLEWLRETMLPQARHVEVVFTGSVPFAEVDDWLLDKDVFLLTSDYEGLPLALVHAMMNGVVPVVSDIPSGIPELVNPATGLTVNIADTIGYARAILSLDAQRNQLAALSQAGRALAHEKYSVQAMARQWLGFLQKPGVEPPPLWPRHFSIQAPLTDPRQWYYHPITRIFRRLLKNKR